MGGAKDRMQQSKNSNTLTAEEGENTDWNSNRMIDVKPLWSSSESDFSSDQRS